VEVFIKPITIATRNALWFFVPIRYRRAPTVFLSHSWDGGVWDLRPPPGSSMWLDLIAVNQHPVLLQQGGQIPVANVLDMYPDVAHVRDVLATVADTVVIVDGHVPAASLPFERSWCVFEMIFTPPGCLRMQIGWTQWDVKEHTRLRAIIDNIDIARADTSSAADKREIDGFVKSQFGDMDAANVLLRRLAREGFLAVVEECFRCGQAQIAGTEDAVDMFIARGVTPLFDWDIVEIYRGD